MMMTMVFVILVLFLSSAVLREYFNDYDVNHWAETEPVEKNSREPQESVPGEQQVLYLGTQDNGYYRAFSEWAGYRKVSLQLLSSPGEITKFAKSSQSDIVLIDGEILETQAESDVNRLSRYVNRGGIVIFYRLPSYGTIRGSSALQELLGIQMLRGETVKLHEIRLYSGFLLGGETCYSFEGVKETEVIDFEREIPWYDISSRTKSYMVGFVSAEEKASMGLNNEDMPAIIWRSSLGNGSVFAVNGDYMKGEASLGILDAMVYETADYSLYPVVNAQNLLITGFPDLTVENREQFEAVYGMTNTQFCRDVLWPSLVAASQKGNWKMTSFLSVKQRDDSENEAKKEDLINYLKFFNEDSTEAGVSLGRMESPSLRESVMDEKNTLENWKIGYTFAGGYLRKENKEQLLSLMGSDGRMEAFRDLRTVVGEYETDTELLSWLTERITWQRATADAYRHTYQDSLRLKSLETALGYSNIQADMYRVLWPKAEGDEWQRNAEKMASYIDTYWKPFAAFDRTTISESDRRVRNFLNGSVRSTRYGNEIFIETKGYTGDAYVLLRTHGETPAEMNGGTWKQVEAHTYLLQLTEEEVFLRLTSDLQPYYKN